MPLTSLLQQLVDQGDTVQPLKQEELPLDPDEIGGPLQDIKTNTAITDSSNASQKSTPSFDDSQSQPSVSGNPTVESMDTSVRGVTSVHIDLGIPTKVSESSSSSQDQPVTMSCGTKVSVNVEVSSNTSVQLTAGEYLSRIEATPVQPVIDLTAVKEKESDESKDQFDDFMDDLDDVDFCTSFTNFDDDDDGRECDPTNYDDKDKEYVPFDDDDDESGSSDDEEWKSEGVDYVKTVAEMAEEAETSDLFDPKVLGKPNCMISD